jgi:hypothetical protein
MRLRHGFLSLVLLTLGGCGELVEDTGQACLVPKDVTCTCAIPEDVACEYPWIPWDMGPLPLEQWVICEGQYSVGAEYEIEAMLRSPGGGPATDEQCSVDVEGKRLIVSSSYRQLPDRDDAVEQAVVVSCEVPTTLDAGTWTLQFGTAEVEFEVGGDEVQDMACALSRYN